MAHAVNQIDKMFEYNLWANTELIELCSGLSEEQLAVEAAGVFGRIRPTLVHLVRAEGGYLNRLTGERPWADDVDWDNIPLSELKEKAERSGRLLIEVCSTIEVEKPHTLAWPNDPGNPYHFFNWTVVLQALYHGIEHRTQVKVLLTQLGVEHPELAAWDYMETLPPNVE